MDNRDLLSKRFPELDFAIVADRWLIYTKDWPIIDQLRDRKISEIRVTIIMAMGLLVPIRDCGFRVLLDWDSSAKDHLETLGHEIGHTFHFNLAKNPPESFFEINRGSNFYKNLIEPFCDAFSEKWIEINDLEKIKLFCRSEKSFIVVNEDCGLRN